VAVDYHGDDEKDMSVGGRCSCSAVSFSGFREIAAWNWSYGSIHGTHGILPRGGTGLVCWHDVWVASTAPPAHLFLFWVAVDSETKS